MQTTKTISIRRMIHFGLQRRLRSALRSALDPDAQRVSIGHRTLLQRPATALFGTLLELFCADSDRRLFSPGSYQSQ